MFRSLRILFVRILRLRRILRPHQVIGFSFAFSGPKIHGAREPEHDGEDRDSFYEPQVVDKTLNRLFHYVYDKFLESRPLSDSLAPPLCKLNLSSLWRGRSQLRARS